MPEMDEDTKLSLEKEATGLYLSGHPLDKYSSVLSRMGLTKTADILSGKLGDGKRVTVAGIMGPLKVKQLKNNSILASSQIEDMYSAISVTVFSKAYELYRSVLTSGKPILLSGKISEREDRDTEIICEKAEFLPENTQNVPQKSNIKSGLYLKVASLQSEEFENVKILLGEYSGNYPVTVVCLDTKRKLLAPSSLNVRKTPELISKLENLLGEKNVKFVEN